MDDVKSHESYPPLPSEVSAVEGAATMMQVRVVIPRWDLNPGQEDGCVTSISPHQKSPTHSRPPSPENLALGPDDVTPEGTVLRRDEDAFPPSRMEEFRRWAGGRRNNPAGTVGKGIWAGQTAEHLRIVPPSICIQAPSSRPWWEEEGRRSPHLFPALRERPLTSGLTPRGRGEGSINNNNNNKVLTTPALCLSGLDKERRPTVMTSVVYSAEVNFDGNRVRAPASASSANGRAWITPRGVSALSSARRIKIPKKQNKRQDGELMMKPLAGQPGIVCLHGEGAATPGNTYHQNYPHFHHHHHHHHHHHQYTHDYLQEDPPPYPYPYPYNQEEDLQCLQQHLDALDPRSRHSGDQSYRFVGDQCRTYQKPAPAPALPGVHVTSAGNGVTNGGGITSAVCSDVKTNHQETSQLLYPGLLPKRSVPGEGVTKPADRHPRSGAHMPTETDDTDDWNLLTDNTHRLSIHSAAHGGGGVPQMSPRSGRGPREIQEASKESPGGLNRLGDVSRARTAPSRRQGYPSSSGMISGAFPDDASGILHGDGRLPAQILYEDGRLPSHEFYCSTLEENVTPRLAVVQLQLSESPAGRSLNLRSSTTTPRRLANLIAQQQPPPHFTSPPFIPPSTSANISSNRNNHAPLMHLDFKPPNSEAVESVERAKHLDSSRPSTRRRRHRRNERPEHDRDDKWDVWRIRVSLSAKHRGNRKRVSPRV